MNSVSNYKKKLLSFSKEYKYSYILFQFKKMSFSDILHYIVPNINEDNVNRKQ